MLPQAASPLRLVAAVVCLLLAGAASASAQALPVIFDTDMGNDVDDALALAMLHALTDRGEANLLAVTITKDNPYTVPFIDLVNTFYGRPDLPIGIAHSGVTPENSDMIRIPAERRRAEGGYVYPRDLTYDDAPDAVEVLRRALVAAGDSSIVVVQVGFSTNLARLLESEADSISPLTGRELAARKVRLLSVMAGDFDHSSPDAEYNVKMDLAAARKLFAEWPTPIVASGFEIGESILYPARSIQRDYGYVEDHPVVDAYRSYLEMPYDRPTWDLTSVLYGVRPDADYFNLSRPGTIVVDSDGLTSFRREENGPHRYLKIGSEAQRQRVLEALIHLASQPPVQRPEP